MQRIVLSCIGPDWAVVAELGVSHRGRISTRQIAYAPAIDFRQVVATCPSCGGSALKAMTPGYSECVSQTVVGMVPRG
jgi:hypothetical protein